MKWKATLVMHSGESRIAVRFEWKAEYIERFKKLPGRRWSKTLNAWHLPDTSAYRIQFGLPQKTMGKEALCRIHPVNHHALEYFIAELKLKGYSENTIRTYTNEFAQLLYLLKDKPVDELSQERYKNYFLYCKQTLKLSENSLHSRINAIKFYVEKVLKREKLFLDIPRPKKHFILPKVLSEEKVVHTLLQTQNLKHRTILMLAYSAGLRVSEVVSIKLEHIEHDRKQLLILKSKGKKDRYVPIGNVMYGLISNYIEMYKPKMYLFEGQYGSEPYSARSAQLIFKQAMKTIGAPSHLSFHSLRHSFATHLLENGIDMKYIQSLLGHNNIKTTAIYTHVSQKTVNKIENPLDKLIRTM